MAELDNCNRLCVFFLSVLGLWPYGSKRFRLYRNIFFSVAIWSSVLVQVLIVITNEITLYRVLRNLSLITITVGSLIRYHASWYQADIVKGFIDKIKFQWQTNDDAILQIMQKHGYVGKQLTIIFASFIFTTGSIMILSNLSPIILDKIVPLNESRPHPHPLELDLWFNDRYTISIALFYYLSIVVQAITYTGLESLTIMICLHISSLFEVTSYCFQKGVSIEATDSYPFRKCSNVKSMRYFINGVILHRETLQFLSDCNTLSKVSYVPIIILGVISLTINLYFLSRWVLHSIDNKEAIIYLLLVIGEIGHMFLINLSIQYTLDSAANISIIIYNTNWYETSIITQKLLQMVILKSNKGFTFTFYNIFDASLRGFVVLFQTTLSYFTVLLSL